jgi:hypothetical protein
MRTTRFQASNMLAVAAAFVLAAGVWPGSAGATDLAQAKKLCAANPNCKDAGGGDFCVKQGKHSCGGHVHCPKQGECTVIETTEFKSGTQKKLVGIKTVVNLLTTGATATKTARRPNLKDLSVTKKVDQSSPMLRTAKPVRPPAAGILDSSPGFSQQGPGATGSPVTSGAPAAPPPVKVY